MVLDSSPHPLNQNGLLATFCDPLPHLASEASLTEGALEPNYDCFILRGKFHHIVTPSLSVNVGENVPQDHFPSISSFRSESDSNSLTLLALNFGCVATQNLVQNGLNS